MTTAPFRFKQRPDKPVIIAGPCMAESEQLMRTVAEAMCDLSRRLDFDYVFKASFDKANRTSVSSGRGPGWASCAKWFEGIKNEFNVPVLTDIHETSQVADVAKVCDVLQIPAFLCRQTDLIVEAVKTGRAVNIKKGQFLAPDGAQHISNKVRAICGEESLSENFALTERGYTFGYGNLVVDMRSFKIMHETGAPTIFDVTHSLQLPSTGGAKGEVSGGLREFAPVLARGAAATGYVDGFFIEVHPNPAEALSDAATQLSIEQASALIEQLVNIWHQAKSWNKKDSLY
jgi:2-dehydro-3-deoxyphosphooctonate aldolase (KDO 8-P synthase)